MCECVCVSECVCAHLADSGQEWCGWLLSVRQFGVCQGRGVRTCVCAGSVQASLCVNGVCGASDCSRSACVRVEGN